MDYKEKYKEALERAKKMCALPDDRATMEYIFPELKESEDEKIRKAILELVRQSSEVLDKQNQNNMVAWLEKQGDPQDKGEISDGYHTFNELYYYRMLYNAAFFNMLPKEWVHKSKRHNDGEECFGGGWFIVMANLPTGQISNHYELKDWDLFQIPEMEVADKWDGHTPQEAADRLHKYLLEKQGEKLPIGFYYVDSNGNKYFSDTFKNGNFTFHVEKGEQIPANSAKTCKDEQNPAWSEEDEKMLDSIIDCIDGTGLLDFDQIDWLKSLKDRI